MCRRDEPSLLDNGECLACVDPRLVTVCAFPQALGGRSNSMPMALVLRDMRFRSPAAANPIVICHVTDHFYRFTLIINAKYLFQKVIMNLCNNPAKSLFGNRNSVDPPRPFTYSGVWW
jgi:hypothetical protein